MDDDRRHALRAIAGVSLHPPQDDYVVEGLSFGSARLHRRREYNGVHEFLILTLTPEATRAAADDQGSDARTVTFRAPGVAAYEASAGFLSAPVAPGLLPLILDEQLLSRPGLLLGLEPPRDPQGPAAATRRMMSAQFGEAIAPTRPTHGFKPFRECDACEGVRVAAKKKANDASIAEAVAAVAAARSRSESTRRERELAWRRQQLVHSQQFRIPAPRDCPHAPWMFDAVQSLCTLHPELVFAILGVIRPAPELSPPRYVLSHEVFKAILGSWLVGRSRQDRYASWRYAFREGTGRRYFSRRDRADEAAALPLEQRNAISFAATAWGTDTPLSALAARPEKTPAFVLDTAVSRDDHLDVALAWSDSAEVSKPEAPKEKPLSRTRKVKAPVTTGTSAARGRRPR